MVDSCQTYAIPMLVLILILTGKNDGGYQPERLALFGLGLEVGSIRRIQGIGYGVLEFLRVGTTFDTYFTGVESPLPKKEPRAGMLTRAMAKELSAASAHECLFVDFLFEEETKKVSEALKHPRWVDAMQEELN
ncbi:hypothetical protein Tco_1303544 [Tanacetum coccineum]